MAKQEDLKRARARWNTHEWLDVETWCIVSHGMMEDER